MLESNEKINLQLEIISDEEANKHFYNVAALCEEFDYDCYGSTRIKYRSPMPTNNTLRINIITLTIGPPIKNPTNAGIINTSTKKLIIPPSSDFLC